LHIGTLSYLAAIVAVGLLIALHELGHLVVARLCGMRVERYSIGFGPTLLRFQRGETEYVLSAIPIGGYVRVAGMSPGEQIDPNDTRAYSHRPAWQRFLVIAAGPVTNELLAVALVFSVAMYGMPVTSRAEVGQVVPSSAAERGGLQPGDLVHAVDGEPIQTFNDLVLAIRSHPGQAVGLDVERGERGEQKLRITVILPRSPVVLGVSAPLRRYGPVEALPAAFAWTARQTVAMVAGLVQALRHPNQAQVQGPIGTVQVTAQEAAHGWQNLISTLALISLALAVFNVLPWPALDGGRLIFLLYELVRRRPVNHRVETAVHAMGFLVLLGLIVLVTVGDVKRWAVGREADASATVDGGP
jgi:regulator of sigma E protease